MTAPDLHVRPYVDADRDALLALWHRAALVRPWNDPDRDLDRKLALADGLLLVAQHGDGRDAPLIATAMVGYDGHRGSIGYLAVDPDHQGRGHGRHLLEECERRLTAMGCPKVNLLVRSSNASVVAFYEAQGYTVDDVVALGKRLIADT